MDQWGNQAFSITGGVASGDVDNDGDIDVFVVTEGRGGTNQNTRDVNQGDGTFSPTFPQPDTPLIESGPLLVDYDGDGLLDIIMGGVRIWDDDNPNPLDPLQPPSIRVYRNLGGLNFADVTATTGLDLSLQLNTYSISAGDINGDQHLDLFLSHWRSSFFGGGGFLWKNEGGGVFTDISAQAGLDALQSTWVFAGNFSDIDGDGDLDLLIAGDFNTSKVFVNDGGGVFSESTGSTLTDQNGMGTAVGDYDGDGDMDWFVSSIFAPEVGLDGNRLYQNSGSGTFTDVGQSAGVHMGHWGWGSCFADFNNDGWLDLFHVNGWQLELQPLFLDNPSVLYLSNGDGTFTESSSSAGLVDTGQGRGVACFDADRDGDIDILVANNDAGPRFYVNQLAESNYLGVVLRGPYPNTQGIGALITITPSIGGTQVREIRAGTNFSSQNPAEAHFGLGDATSVDLTVRWPDGMMSNLTDVPANQLLVLSHPSL